MMIRTEIVQNVDGRWWNDLIHSAHGEFQQTTFSSSFQAEVHGKKPYYVIVEENGTPLGLSAFFLEGYGQDWVNGRFPQKLSRVPVRMLQMFGKSCSLIHGPVILDSARESEILKHVVCEIDRFSEQEHLFLWKTIRPSIHRPSFIPSIWEKAFSHYGFQSKPWGTFLVDLTVDEDVLWTRLKNSARKAIKKIQKHDVSFVYVDNKALFEKYCRVISETRCRANILPAFDKQLLYRWWQKNAERLQFFLVEFDGKPLAAQGVFLFSSIIREVFAGTSNYAIEQKLYGGDLLKFETLKWAKTQGLHCYDLAGVHPNPSTMPEKNIRQFKEKWGGEYVEYPVFRKIYGIRRHALLKKLQGTIKRENR